MTTCRYCGHTAHEPGKCRHIDSLYRVAAAAVVGRDDKPIEVME